MTKDMPRLSPHTAAKAWTAQDTQKTHTGKSHMWERTSGLSPRQRGKEHTRRYYTQNPYTPNTGDSAWRGQGPCTQGRGQREGDIPPLPKPFLPHRGSRGGGKGAVQTVPPPASHPGPPALPSPAGPRGGCCLGWGAGGGTDATWKGPPGNGVLGGGIGGAGGEVETGATPSRDTGRETGTERRQSRAEAPCRPGRDPGGAARPGGRPGVAPALGDGGRGRGVRPGGAAVGAMDWPVRPRGKDRDAAGSVGAMVGQRPGDSRATAAPGPGGTGGQEPGRRARTRGSGRRRGEDRRSRSGGPGWPPLSSSVSGQERERCGAEAPSGFPASTHLRAGPGAGSRRPVLFRAVRGVRRGGVGRPGRARRPGEAA